MADTTNGKELLQKAAAIKGETGFDLGFERNRTILTGALIGAGGGFYLGYVKKGNLLVAGLVGAVVGVILSSVFLPSS